MCKKILSACLSVLFLTVLLSVPALAAVQASDQIRSWNTAVTATTNGQIAIYFTVDGTRLMDTIGAQEIKVYKYLGTQWHLMHTYTQDDEGMTASQAYWYENTIYHQGTAADTYYIEVTIFAENSAGSDSRTEGHYVTAR